MLKVNLGDYATSEIDPWANEGICISNQESRVQTLHVPGQTVFLIFFLQADNLAGRHTSVSCAKVEGQIHIYDPNPYHRLILGGPSGGGGGIWNTIRDGNPLAQKKNI